MGRKVKILRPDNGVEYTSKEFKNYLVRKGIEYQLSIPGRPEQNRVAERMNRTLTEHAVVSDYRLKCQKNFRHGR